MLPVSEHIEEQVVGVILELAGVDSLDEYRTEAVAVSTAAQCGARTNMAMAAPLSRSSCLRLELGYGVTRVVLNGYVYIMKMI